MGTVPDWTGLQASLAASGIVVTARRPAATSLARFVSTPKGPVFLKTLPAVEGGLLEAECDGLAALAATGTVRTPAVLACGATQHDAWLARLDLCGLSGRTEGELGCALARLHGDLWAGNAAAFGNVPVIFDPAVYFGNRETDVAMTRLLAGL